MEITEIMFWISSIWIIPFWGLMWFLPKHEITANFDAIEKSSKLILPGVGSFYWSMH